MIARTLVQFAERNSSRPQTYLAKLFKLTQLTPVVINFAPVASIGSSTKSGSSHALGAKVWWQGKRF